MKTIYYIVVCKGKSDTQHHIVYGDDYKTPFITSVLQEAFDRANKLAQDFKDYPECPVYDVLRCE